MTLKEQIPDLSELERIAREATQGEWTVIQSGLHGDSYLVCEDVPGHLKPVCAAEYDHPLAEANATHIATFNPETVLRLIALAREGEGLSQGAKVAHPSVRPDEPSSTGKVGVFPPHDDKPHAKSGLSFCTRCGVAKTRGRAPFCSPSSASPAVCEESRDTQS